MPERRIEPLNDAENAWVAQELENCRQLVLKYSPIDAQAPLTLEVLDRTYKAAYDDDPKEDEQHANSVINAIGIAFGQCLVDRLGLEWCAVFDNFGSELAVVGHPGEAEMLVCPTNLVAKRWTAGTTDFLWYVFKGIEEDFANFREHPESYDQRPSRTTPFGGGVWGWIRRFFS